jgi:hypothetical protein
MKVVAFYWENTANSRLDAFCYDTEKDCILKLIEVMKKFNRDDTLFWLKTALMHVRLNEINEALQCLDTWCEEYKNQESNKVFTYKIKEHKQ